MTYKKLPFYSYIEFIYKYKIILLAVILIFFVLLVSQIKNDLKQNDNALWLKGSTEYNKLLNQEFPFADIKKITIYLGDRSWSPEVIHKLKLFQARLEQQKNVFRVDSFLSQKEILPIESNRLIKSLYDYPIDDVYKYMIDHSQQYPAFISRDLKTIQFFVLSSSLSNLELISCNFKFSVDGTKNDTYFQTSVLFAILFLILFISFFIAFRTFLPSILGILFISMTTASTIALFQIFSSVKTIHISIILISITISVMEFIYIYYKWHVLQKHLSAKHTLYRVLAKTSTPIFWTSFISIVGIGSLMFVDSYLLYTIGLNVVLSALTGLLFSITLLPVFLSFFTQKNPFVFTKESSHFFAKKEAGYKPKILIIFLLLSLFALIYSVVSYSNNSLAMQKNNKQIPIQIALEEKGVNLNTISSLGSMQNELKEEFSHIASFTSLYSIVEKMYKLEHKNKRFNLAEINIQHYLDSFDLYLVGNTLIMKDRLILTLYLDDDASQADILNYVRDQGFLIQDVNSLVYLAKSESINMLFYIVLLVLSLIMLTVFYITKSFEFTFIALLVNIIPLIWFFTAILSFKILLSTEIFVAMIITVALSSDATLHFIYYYYNNRFKPRDATKTLEISFIYIGTPIGMGNLILVATFALLVFIPNASISNIGLYSTLLILFSLFVDLFILPILFLYLIKKNRKIKSYFYARK